MHLMCRSHCNLLTQHWASPLLEADNVGLGASTPFPPNYGLDVGKKTRGGDWPAEAVPWLDGVCSYVSVGEWSHLRMLESNGHAAFL